MPRPNRIEQFDGAEACIVHVVHRCVRRAFLAVVDHASGKVYSFRKEWIRRRTEAIASVFALDVLSYAIISNHIHVIVRNRPDVVALWDDRQVSLRWLKVFPGRRMGNHLAEPTEHEVQTLAGNAERIAEIRTRLSAFPGSYGVWPNRSPGWPTGKQIASAAYDLVPVPTKEAAKEIRETPVDQMREKRKSKRRNPTGRRVKRDS